MTICFRTRIVWATTGLLSRAVPAPVKLLQRRTIINDSSRHRRGFKFLSIVDKVSLSEEHIKAFKQLKMVSYRETDTISKSSSSVICINSLLKLSRITNTELKTLVVYIDEIDSFLKFTHNSTIQLIKPIYILLKRIVNNCAKLIVSDATIFNNLFLFLRNFSSQTAQLLSSLPPFPSLKYLFQQLF